MARRVANRSAKQPRPTGLAFPRSALAGLALKGNSMAPNSRRPDSIESTPNLPHHKFTLSDLLTSLQESEQAVASNLSTADKVEREQSSIAALWWRTCAGALRFQPNPIIMPGIDQIQLLCEEFENGNGLTAANVAKLRIKICQGKPCSMDEANALPLIDAANALNHVLRRPNNVARTVAKKKSTTRGDGRNKLIAALTKHHKYSEGTSLNWEPIGSNQLAKAAEVSASTASIFFKDKFKGHNNYKGCCQDSAKLIAALRLLNDEYAPHVLFGRHPASEGTRDDE